MSTNDEYNLNSIKKFPWLTKEFLENILKSYETTVHQLAIKNFVIEPGVPKGENYASDLIRVKIKYIGIENVLKNISFVLKIEINDDFFQNTLKEISVFKKEIIVYRDILPKVEEYLERIGKSVQLAPKCYGTNEKPNFVILQDLKTFNFCNVDRRIGMNFQLTEILLKKLASFHAVTAKLLDENPALFAAYHKGTAYTQNKNLIPMFRNHVLQCAHASKNWEGYEKYSDLMVNSVEFALKKLIQTYHVDEQTFCVLTQGDLWVNNIMFKFNEHGNAEDVLMVDFQLGCIGSIGVDLGYLLFTSTSNDVYEDDWDKLLEIYYSEFTLILNLLNFSKNIPTLNDIKTDIIEKATFGVISSFNALAIRNMEMDEDANLQNFVDDTEVARNFRNRLYNSDNTKTRLQYLLDYYERKGIFESWK